MIHWFVSVFLASHAAPDMMYVHKRKTVTAIDRA